MQPWTQESHSNDASRAAVASRSYRAMVWGQFKRDRLAVTGLVLILGLFLVAIFAPVLANEKPILMRWKGELSSPLLREIFAPSESPEFFLERLFNFALVYIVASCVVLLPAYFLLARVGAARRRILRWVALGLVVICALPFFLVRSRLDKTTDYRQMALEARSKPGDWLLLPPVAFGPFRQGTPYQTVSRTHPMGTDRAGRDVLSRVIHGSRVSLSVGFLSVGVALIIGVFIGSISAYHGGWLDLILQRVVEVVICFPTFLLILTILAYWEKRSIFNVMLVIGLTTWTGFARLVRGQMLQQKTRDYAVAAQALGVSAWRIIFRHLLPNSIAPVLVAATFGVAGAILTESGLSFLGFGVSLPTASWGELLNQALVWPVGYWWLTTWPGFMIFITVTLYNLVGEGLRDALDPRMRV